MTWCRPSERTTVAPPPRARAASSSGPMRDDDVRPRSRSSRARSAARTSQRGGGGGGGRQRARAVHGTAVSNTPRDESGDPVVDVRTRTDVPSHHGPSRHVWNAASSGTPYVLSLVLAGQTHDTRRAAQAAARDVITHPIPAAAFFAAVLYDPPFLLRLPFLFRFVFSSSAATLYHEPTTHRHRDARCPRAHRPMRARRPRERTTHRCCRIVSRDHTYATAS